MTLRRYAQLKASAGTVIPAIIRINVRLRDDGCVGPRAGLPGECLGSLELDHVRASHGMGMKSESTETNLVMLCGIHHLWKTEHGREGRPLLLAYLERAGNDHAAHVDPAPGCVKCYWPIDFERGE